MLGIEQLTFIEPPGREAADDDWTFNGVSTRELTHCYHDYPARMAPRVVGKLLDSFGGDAGCLFDPYCGSGTSLVEANVRGVNAYGADLNPLAGLIARAKTATPDVKLLENQIALFTKRLLSEGVRKVGESPKIRGVSRPDFWFKPAVIDQLAGIREFINEIIDEEVRLFFQVAFSETVRESSNARNEEFKLYRYAEEKLARFNPNASFIMSAKLHRNLCGYKRFKAIIDGLKRPPFTKIYNLDVTGDIPEDLIRPESIDIVVTSPPYGDSSTTVAYGQYSRLSAAWLELEEADRIDRKLMGEKPIKDFPHFPSKPLNIAINKIREADEKRARKVASFYADLLGSISNVARVVKKNGHVCYAVGNRKVKGVVLPTDIAVRDFFESHGFEHVGTFIRSIPNKRMPSKNSPANAARVVDDTMTLEHIVVMRRSCASALKPAVRRLFRTPGLNGLDGSAQGRACGIETGSGSDFSAARQ